MADKVVTNHTGVVIKAAPDCCTINHPGIGSLKFYEADIRKAPLKGVVKFGESLKGKSVSYTLVADGKNYRITDVRRAGIDV